MLFRGTSDYFCRGVRSLVTSLGAFMQGFWIQLQDACSPSVFLLQALQQAVKVAGILAGRRGRKGLEATGSPLSPGYKRIPWLQARGDSHLVRHPCMSPEQIAG